MGAKRTMRGKYIVIEGAEGVGKTTQIRKIADALRGMNVPVEVFREPDGESDRTTGVIRQITQDSSYPMNSRTEVFLYNAARSQSLEKINIALEEGKICLVDRSFLTTLAIQYYGRGDIDDYVMLNQIIDFAVGDVKPDLTLVLDAPVDVLMSRKALTKQTERFDQLEAPFLERVRSGYLWEARQRDLPVIYAIGSEDEVFRDIWKHIVNLLNHDNKMALEENVVTAKNGMNMENVERNNQQTVDQSSSESVKADSNEDQTKSGPMFSTPKDLYGEIRKQYLAGMDGIITSHKIMAKNLTQYLLDQKISNTPSEASNMAEQHLRALLPLSAVKAQFSHQNLDDTVRSLADKLLPRNWATIDEKIKLIQATPRNELESISDALYEYSDLSMNDIAAVLRAAPYDAKVILLTEQLNGNFAHKILKAVTYKWDLITDYVCYDDFASHANGTDIITQSPSPRMGFETPAIIEQAGLDDAYAECFDKSLALHSTMQAAGHMEAAESAVLCGHFTRWSLTISALQLYDLIFQTSISSTNPSLSKLIEGLAEKTAEYHPIIGEFLLNKYRTRI